MRFTGRIRTKYGRLANLAAEDAGQLRDQVIEELVTLKHQPALLAAFIEETGLNMAA